MTDGLGKEIDTWLRAQRRWVPSAEIEQLFDVPERRLRFDGGRPGLLSFNAISSSSGYKHIANCSDEEFTEAHRHDLKPLKSRFFVLRRRRDARRRERTMPLPLPIFQPDLL